MSQHMSNLTYMSTQMACVSCDKIWTWACHKMRKNKEIQDILYSLYYSA